MSWNVPDDWGSFYSTCGECGQRYHLSGVESCACAPEDETEPPRLQCCYCDWIGTEEETDPNCLCPICGDDAEEVEGE